MSAPTTFIVKHYLDCVIYADRAGQFSWTGPIHPGHGEGFACLDDCEYDIDKWIEQAERLERELDEWAEENGPSYNPGYGSYRFGD